MTNNTQAITGSNLIPFSFEGAEVRVFDQIGELWWVLTDVCKVLEIRNSRDAADRLDDDEKGVAIIDTLGGPQEMTIINESGLWSLVLTSRKAAAKRFKKWITAEVIPSIRKTGGYTMVAPETHEQLAMRALTGLQSIVEKQREQLAIAKPKAAALDRISASGGEFGLTETAKMIQVKPGKFFDWLDQNRCRYSKGRSKMAYQERIDAGYLKNRANPYIDANSEPQVGNTIKVTAKGLAWFARVVPGAELDPIYAHLTENDAKAGLRNLAKKAGAPPFAKKPEPVS